MSRPAPLDPEGLLLALAQHEVDYVLIGALAARLYGFPRVTADADITPSREVANLDRLSAALNEIEARVYTEGTPGGLDFDCTAETLGRAEMWNLVTRFGRLDIAFEPSGTNGFQDLDSGASSFEAFGISIRVASLEDILRSKEAADRPQDREDAVVLRQMLRRER